MSFLNQNDQVKMEIELIVSVHSSLLRWTREWSVFSPCDWYRRIGVDWFL